jgi:transcriptional regulator GlxA family with amidase domain
MAEVVSIVFDNCQPTALSAVVEALAVANLHYARDHGAESQPFIWRTLSKQGRPVRTMGRLTLVVDGDLDELGEPDLIFLPAILSNEPDRMLQQIVELEEELGDLLRLHHARNCILAANCSAVFLLAESGLLTGRSATTSWWLTKTFAARYPRVQLQPTALITKDERIFCAAAFSACLNLGVAMVEQFLGPQVALSCARVMLVDVNRATQLPYANLAVQSKHCDELVLRAQTILMSSLTQPMDIAALANRLGVTTRTLGRRFNAAIGESPSSFVQNARMERAKRFLENSTKSIDKIAQDVGFEDTSAFRRLFRRTTGISPGEYRHRFGATNSFSMR